MERSNLCGRVPQRVAVLPLPVWPVRPSAAAVRLVHAAPRTRAVPELRGILLQDSGGLSTWAPSE